MNNHKQKPRSCHQVTTPKMEEWTTNDGILCSISVDDSRPKVMLPWLADGVLGLLDDRTLRPQGTAQLGMRGQDT
jgi:hypothetical protein